MKNEVFTYNGSPITFQLGNGAAMINATEMAKPFGKMPKDWLINKQTSEFLNALSSVRRISLSQLVVVNKGNSADFQQGTWMHEDVAIEFARWLAPAFAIWCNDRIKELLTKGHAELNNLSPAEQLLRMAQIAVEQERRTKALEAAQAATSERLKVLEAKQHTSPDYFTVVGYATLVGVRLPLEEAKRIGRAAAAICKRNGYMTGKCNDMRFGQVKTYPKDVLSALLTKV